MLVCRRPMRTALSVALVVLLVMRKTTKLSVCCNELNLYNSVRPKSPICGSSLEKSIIGCENGTFADGNTMLLCRQRIPPRRNYFHFDGKATMSILIPVVHSPITVITTGSGNVYVCNSAASCCAQGGAGFKCEDIYKPNPSNPPAIDDTTLYQTINVLFAVSPANPTTTLSVMSTPTSIIRTYLCRHSVVDVVRSTCSTDAGGEGAPYGKVTQYDNNGKVDPFDNGGQEFIDVQAIVSLASAKLGGYGPDPTVKGNNSLDALAKVYPYNAFLNQALQTNAPREASGTFGAS